MCIRDSSIAPVNSSARLMTDKTKEEQTALRLDVFPLLTDANASVVSLSLRLTETQRSRRVTSFALDLLRTMPNVEIPLELPTLLRNFTLSVLRTKPTDLVDYAADYFQELQRQHRLESTSVEDHRPSEGKSKSVIEGRERERNSPMKIDIRSLMIDKNSFLDSSSLHEETEEQIVDQYLRDRRKCARAFHFSLSSRSLSFPETKYRQISDRSSKAPISCATR